MRGGILLAALVLVAAGGCESVPVAKLNPLSVPVNQPETSPSPNPTPSPTAAPPKPVQTTKPVNLPPQAPPCGRFTLALFNAYPTRPNHVFVIWATTGACSNVNGWINYVIEPSHMIDFGQDITTFSGSADVMVGTGVCQPPHTTIVVQLYLHDQAQHNVTASKQVTLYC